MSTDKNYTAALDLIEKFLDKLSYTPARDRIECAKWQIYADRFMIGRDNESGERIMIREVVDYFCTKHNAHYQYPVTAARVLEWIGCRDEAELLLAAEEEQSWRARYHLALLFDRAGKMEEALACAKRLLSSAPWRAESYDLLAFVARNAEDTATQAEARTRGDQIFDKEMALFDDLRTILV